MLRGREKEQCRLKAGAIGWIRHQIREGSFVQALGPQQSFDPNHHAVCLPFGEAECSESAPDSIKQFRESDFGLSYFVEVSSWLFGGRRTSLPLTAMPGVITILKPSPSSWAHAAPMRVQLALRPSPATAYAV